MSLHRAVLRTRDLVRDGVAFPVIRDEVPIGKEYVADMGRPTVERTYWNEDVGNRWMATFIWVNHNGDAPDGWGLPPRELFDIEEGELG